MKTDISNSATGSSGSTQKTIPPAPLKNKADLYAAVAKHHNIPAKDAKQIVSELSSKPGRIPVAEVAQLWQTISAPDFNPDDTLEIVEQEIDDLADRDKTLQQNKTADGGFTAPEADLENTLLSPEGSDTVYDTSGNALGSTTEIIADKLNLQKGKHTDGTDFVLSLVLTEDAPKSNAKFLAKIFEEDEEVYTCAFKTDPGLKTSWRNKFSLKGSKTVKYYPQGHAPIPGTYITPVMSAECNTYYDIAARKETTRLKKKGEEGETETGIFRTNEAVKYARVFVIDDIASKGSSIEDLFKILPPSYLIETSENNFQAGYILDEGLSDVDMISHINAVLNKGHGDIDAKGASRYCRLPFGLNTKTKYLVEGKPWTVKLRHWNGIKYNVHDIMKAFDVPLTLSVNNDSMPDYAGTGRGNENLKADDLNSVLSIEKILKVLEEFPAGKPLTDAELPPTMTHNHFDAPRSLWVSILTIIANNYLLAALRESDKQTEIYKEHLNVAVEWSKRDKKGFISEDDVKDKFDELTNYTKGRPEDKKLSFGTLLLILKHRHPAKATAIIKSAESVWLDRYIFYAHENKVYDRNLPANFKAIPMAGFKELHAGDKQALKNWRESSKRLVVYGELFMPGKPDIFQHNVGGKLLWFKNTYYAPQHGPCPSPAEMAERIDIVTRHFKHLFKNQPDNAMEDTLDFLAHSVQDPLHRPQFALLLVATNPGTGRSWIMQMMKGLMGEPFVGSIDSGVAFKTDKNKGHFDDAKENKCFLFIHEVTPGGTRLVLDQEALNNLINAMEETLNIKGGSQVRVVPKYALMMFSNYIDAMRLPPKDNRVLVHSCNPEVQSDEFYTDLYQWLEDPLNLSAMYHWLKERKINLKMQGRARMTEAKQRMIESFMNVTEKAFNMFMLSDNLPEVIASGDMHDIVENIFEAEAKLQNSDVPFDEQYYTTMANRVAPILKQIDKPTQGRKIKVKGKVVRVRCLKRYHIWRAAKGAEISNACLKISESSYGYLLKEN